MIILGLGSNIGNRLQQLRQALQTLKQLPGLAVKKVSPIYISDAQLPTEAPPSWNHSFLNCAIACECSLSPSALLAAIKKIEVAMGRDVSNQHWSPRVIDIDILTWQQEVIKTDGLTIPHPSLHQRPFALWPLADLTPLWQDPTSQQAAEQLIEPWGSRFTGTAPFHTRQIQQRIDTPALVGIVNITPDSFSDGGKFSSVEQAFHQAVHLIEAGAEILDIGAESTAPSAKELKTELEWQRLSPVLDAIMQAKQLFLLPPLVSVDTRHAAVASLALEKNVDWINDVTGFNDPTMRAAVRESTVDCVVMHHLSIPPRRDFVLPRDQDPVDFLYRWSAQQIDLLEKEGISRSRIIIDPGFGFGKSPGQALRLLKNMERFTDLGVRTLVGHSRKSFMGIFTPHAAPDRDLETLAISQHLMQQPVDYLRIHQVENCARAFKVQAALSA